jgi:glycosyltransferase involved in cell wall biosynthesis
MKEWQKVIPPILGMGNDWTVFEREVELKFKGQNPKKYDKKVSIIIPVYNRKDKLGKTIAALTHSTYPLELMEVIIADDGSSDSPEELIPIFEKYFPIHHVFQEDLGYRLSEVRNLGVNSGIHDCTIILDCDMLPLPTLVESYMQYMHISNRLLLIGGRRYVNTDSFSMEEIVKDIVPVLQLPSQCVDTGREPKGDEAPSEDWRYKYYLENENLKSSKYPFRFSCGGNICFHQSLFDEIEGFDESFTAWGAEDQEFGYRAYRAGAWFIPVNGAEALHQEPLNGSNETDRESGRAITRPQLIEKVPSLYRKYEPGVRYEIPKVSVYMPVYNCIEFVQDAINSALNQTYTDLEVIVCNDGSTDGTGTLLEELYGDDPRVVIIHQENGGISSASNRAIKASKGEYILQLDSDDMILPETVESLVKVLDENPVGFAYGDSFLIDSEGKDLGRAYSWSLFDRLKLLDGMIIHHPRMFRRRDYNRTAGFDESISNAVDYDFFLKLAEITDGYHLQTPLYLYRQHTSNTSKVDKSQQDSNNNYCIERAFERMGLLGRISLEEVKGEKRKLEKILIKDPKQFGIDLTHYFGKCGIKHPNQTRIHPHQFSEFNSPSIRQRIANSHLANKKIIRVGPFGSLKTAGGVAERIKRKGNEQSFVCSMSDEKPYLYMVEVKVEGTDNEAIKLRRTLQEEFNWNAEIVYREGGNQFSARNKSTLKQYSQYQSIKNEEELGNIKISNYDVGEFWRFEGGRLIFTWNEEEVFFEMPLNWQFEETHHDLFQLAHFVLVEPWDKTVLDNWNPSRKAGWRPGLAFSGGIDSTAALALMPSNTVLLYNERAEIPGQLDHTNAIRFFDNFEKKTNRPVIRIRSNHERLRQLKGKNAGFSSDYACAVQCIILADHFGLDSIATGMPLENSYLFHGYRYRNFNKSRFWNRYAPIFESVGLPLYQPVAGCSEIINMKISEHQGWSGWAQSCIRSSKEGFGCGGCWKCFRKNTMMGLPFSMSNEIETFLSKKPLKQAASTLYSIQQNAISSEGINIVKKFPHLKPFLALELDFLLFHHEPAMELIPHKYRKFTEDKLEQYVLPMTRSALTKLKRFDLYSDNE